MKGKISSFENVILSKKNIETSKCLREVLHTLKDYFCNYEKDLARLDCFVISRSVYDYYVKYKKHFVGTYELSAKYDRGMVEGIIKLEDDVYLALVSMTNNAYYVLGFAEDARRKSAEILSRLELARFHALIVAEEFSGQNQRKED